MAEHTKAYRELALNYFACAAALHAATSVFMERSKLPTLSDNERVIMQVAAAQVQRTVDEFVEKGIVDWQAAQDYAGGTREVPLEN
jgi:hypothetical protein